MALEPDQPNPHDSYGEILRMAGKFDAALEQYRMSIRIDPNFGSELGVADTYALMGKELEAREEYDRAIVFAPSDGDKVQRELQSAVTWIRENNRKQAERALAMWPGMRTPRDWHDSKPRPTAFWACTNLIRKQP